MLIHRINNFILYFGDSSDGFFEAQHEYPQTNPLMLEPFRLVHNKMDLEQLAFPLQTHGTRGIVADTTTVSFETDSDFIITAQTRLGVGILTADCLPLALYDTKHHVATMVHAGWRGAVAQIVPHAIKFMQHHYGTEAQHVQAFLGPCAKMCCYQVGPEFPALVGDLAPQTLEQRTNALYFNNALFNRLLLMKAGVPESAISDVYNLCTMCNHQFFSHRRQKEAAGRNMSIIALL